MKLTDLNPLWMTDVKAGSHSPGKVGTQAEAQGIRFRCPKCITEIPGSHDVVVPFAGRGVPDDAYPGMARWEASGHYYEDLTLGSSIQLIGGCEWHGNITDGEVTIL